MAGDINFAAAEQACYEVGARMCSLDEMLDGVTIRAKFRTGNLCFGDFFWTSTPCGENGEGRMIAGQGGRMVGQSGFFQPSGSISNQCVDPSIADELHQASCCSQWTNTDLRAQLNFERSLFSARPGTFDYCRHPIAEGLCEPGEGHCGNGLDCLSRNCAADAGVSCADPDSTFPPRLLRH